MSKQLVSGDKVAQHRADVPVFARRWVFPLVTSDSVDDLRSRVEREDKAINER
jgi:hypothetical protein